MAAPADKTTKNLSGVWNLNKSISDSADPGLVIQGMGYLTRTAISMASISLDINQYEAPPKEPSTSTDIVTHIDLDQTAAGVSTTTEKRCLDGVFREHNDKVFGDVKGISSWVSVQDINDEFLKKGWEVESDSSKELIRSFVKSVDKSAGGEGEDNEEEEDGGWIATQIWGFQTVNGERRYCRNIVIEKKKSNQRAEFRFVYDYQE